MAKGKFISKPGRTSPPIMLGYAHQIFKASAAVEGGTPKYGVTSLYDKKNKEHMAFIKALHADMEAVLKEHWPDKADRPRTKLVGETASPIKDGDKTVNKKGIPYNETNPEYLGHYFIRTYSKDRPVVVDRNVEEILDSNEIYSGCIAKLSMNVYSYEVGVNAGVTIGLNGVQKWADGDAIGNSKPAASDMFESAGADDPANYASDDDPFAGSGPAASDDDVPF